MPSVFRVKAEVLTAARAASTAGTADRVSGQACSTTGAAAAAAAAAAAVCYMSAGGAENEPGDVPSKAGDDRVISRAELVAHRSEETGVWVSYKGEVFDITEFIVNHPGGVSKIMLAAGKDIGPFWRVYQQHLRPGRLCLPDSR